MVTWKFLLLLSEARSFAGALKKFKDQEILAILKLEDDNYMVFIEE